MVRSYIGKMFISVLAYADDIVLLAASAHAMLIMLIMLSICDDYAKEFTV